MVLRHGKSDWSAGQPDHERPLNPRGERQAGEVGVLLDGAGHVPELILTSTAVRARTTAEHVLASTGWTTPLVEEPRLYESTADRTIARLRSVDDEVSTVMVVGHQPTWSVLVERLTGTMPDMRTSAAAVIDLPLDSWAHLDEGTGHFRELLRPT